MSYELFFHARALKEWKKLPSDIKNEFKKVLRRRLEQPFVESAALSKNLKGCYKIKLRQSGYRLVYHAEKDKLEVMVVAVGKRDKGSVYSLANLRYAF